MRTKAGHLSYCTNIHPGEDWMSHFKELKKHLPGIKKQTSPDAKMGIGLRLNRRMQRDLENAAVLNEFKSWLESNNYYVFTLNGFPYGDFHDAVIKDRVHYPDWTHPDRLDYTLRLFNLLAAILPDDMPGGGISTSPLSYRFWHPTENDKTAAIRSSTNHIIKVAENLDELYRGTNKSFHLDIEPEPDGLLGTGDEFINWYEKDLLPMAIEFFGKKGHSSQSAEEIIHRHIQMCYDVCHIAVGFENQKELIDRLERKNIRIGKIQISAALKLEQGIPPRVLKDFVEEQYLHQVVIQSTDKHLIKFKDLDKALKDAPSVEGEWRIHFHVPIFTDTYKELSSTRDYIHEILNLLRDKRMTDQLEIETYTWDVLPTELQIPIGESITREIQYILKIIKQNF